MLGTFTKSSESSTKVNEVMVYQIQTQLPEKIFTCRSKNNDKYTERLGLNLCMS